MFLPNCENMLPVRKCLSVEIDTSPLVILVFFQVSYPAHHEQIILVKRDLPTFVNKLGNKLFFLITIKFYHM